MSHFEVHEFSFELPGDGWEERTLNYFQRRIGATFPTVTISRDPGAGGTPEEISANALRAIRESDDAPVRIAGVRESMVGPLPAQEVRLVVGEASPKGAIVQQSVYFRYYADAMSISVTAPMAEAGYAEETLRRLTEATRLRRR